MNSILVLVILGLIKISLSEVTQLENETITSTISSLIETSSGASLSVSQTSPSRFRPPAICLQPQIRGDCRALFRRYFFDQTASACREFFYGGCGGNENNFATKAECEVKCLAAVTGSTEEPDNATGATKLGQCPPSNAPIHDQSDGNVTISCSPSCTQDSECANNQLCCNVDACGRAICMAPMPVRSRNTVPPLNPVCQKTLDSGPCRAFFPRWGHDGFNCIQFVYGGCNGNENNFDTKEECESACSSLPSTTTACPMIKMVPPPGCEVITNTNPIDGCPKPEIKCTEGACSGSPCPNLCDNCVNEPKQCFTTPCPQYRCEPKANCGSARIGVGPPQLPTPPQLPDALVQSVCSLILCAPNSVCRELQGFATCVPNAVVISQSKASSRAQEVCTLQPDTGRCRAAIERWFFNVLSSRCERFIYGGCGGNENNFDSRQACESFCSVFINTASREKDGQCPRIDGFADQVGICADECSFDLQCPGERKCCPNACGGRVCAQPTTAIAIENTTTTITTTAAAANIEASPTTVVDNVRISQPKVLSSKLEVMRRCRQHVETGPCKAAFQRWYFNIVTGECELFIYGGCAGNTNNFESQEQCQQTCDQVAPCPQYSPPVPAPGCTVVSWTGTNGCPAIGFKCTEGECTRATCPGTCDFCVNEPKACLQDPCPQFRCQANDTCLYEQCASVRCADGLVCQIGNGSVVCLPDETSPINRCTQPKDSGQCEAAMIRYYFNSATGQCEQFIYGGCNGNGNRFETQQECERTCPGNRGIRM